MRPWATESEFSQESNGPWVNRLKPPCNRRTNSTMVVSTVQQVSAIKPQSPRPMIALTVVLAFLAPGHEQAAAQARELPPSGD